jgi:hypothetical protein
MSGTRRPSGGFSDRAFQPGSALSQRILCRRIARIRDFFVFDDLPRDAKSRIGSSPARRRQCRLIDLGGGLKNQRLNGHMRFRLGARRLPFTNRNLLLQEVHA